MITLLTKEIQKETKVVSAIESYAHLAVVISITKKEQISGLIRLNFTTLLRLFLEANFTIFEPQSNVLILMNSASLLMGEYFISSI